MTETSSGSAARGGKGTRKGLTMQRIHTRDGVHPYDDVAWELDRLRQILRPLGEAARTRRGLQRSLKLSDVRGNGFAVQPHGVAVRHEDGEWLMADG